MIASGFCDDLKFKKVAFLQFLIQHTRMFTVGIMIVRKKSQILKMPKKTHKIGFETKILWRLILGNRITNLH
jgi:hypothetical protein